MQKPEGDRRGRGQVDRLRRDVHRGQGQRPGCKNCDHPWTVAYGGDVYTAYAHAKNHYLSHSSDGGTTWTETDVLQQDTVAFPEGAVLDASAQRVVRVG